MHQDISKPESPLEAQFSFFHRVQACFVDGEASLGHSRECSDDAWKANGRMRNGVFDIPDKDDFILVDAAVGLPVEVSHGVEFSALRFGAPGGHEGAMDSFPVHEVFEVLDDGEKVVFDEVKEMWVLNS